MASRSRRSSSGGGGRGGKKLITFFVVAGLIFAFYQIPYDPGAKGIYQIMVSKSDNVQKWVNGIAPNVVDKVKKLIQGGSEKPSTGGGGSTGGSNGGSSGTPGGSGGGSTGGNNGSTGGSTPDSKSALTNKINTLKVSNGGGASYDRSEWKHWINVRSCWTTREQVLADEAVSKSLVLKDSSGNKTTDVNKACEIVSGTWNDPYSGKTFTNPRALDVDHVIPLGYVAQHGGQAWSTQKKQDYANNLKYAGHLDAVSLSENRSKGDKGPAAWKPTNKNDWCQYSTDWATIASTWNITVTQADANALKDMANTCK